MLTETYNELINKYGFNDAEDIPYGIETVRKKIISLINKGLSKDSSVEARPYDRPGLHNWCLIEYRNKKTGQLSDEPVDEVRQILHDAELDGWSIAMNITMKKLRID